MTRHMFVPGPRLPEMFDEAREWRVLAENGVLTEFLPGGRTRTLAQPGEVARVVILDGTTIPRRLVVHRAVRIRAEVDDVLVVLGQDDQVLFASPVWLWTAQNMPGGKTAHAAIGVEEFARALGAQITAPTAEDVRRVRRRDLSWGPARQVSQRLGLLRMAIYALSAALFLYWTLNVDDAGPTSEHWLNALTLLPCVAGWGFLLWMHVREMRSWRRPRTTSGRPDQAVAGEWGWTVQFGLDRRELCVSDGAAEHWLAGPTDGGPDNLAFRKTHLLLRRGKTLVLVLPGYFDRDQVLTSARLGGLDIEKREPWLNDDDATTDAIASLARQHYILEPRMFPTGQDVSVSLLIVPLLCSVGGFMGGAAGFFAQSRPQPSDYVLGIAGSGLCLAGLAIWLPTKRLIKRIRISGTDGAQAPKRRSRAH